MDKAQTIHNFWGQFGIPAFDQYTVPVGQKFPYLTYSVQTDSFERPLILNANLWYKSTSWKEISQKAEEIAKYIETQYPVTIELDEGRVYITKGTPFAQRLDDPSDDTIRRMYLTVQVEFLTRW